MNETRFEKLFAEFKNPGSRYRGAPFWAWNGKLKPEELKRQIRTMKKMGLGGFFMHSRVGLDTPYLSGEWFECIKACVDEAKKLDMNAWLYDEDRWPSGAAGGLVTKNPKYRMRSLVMEKISDPKRMRLTKDTIAVFAASFKDGILTNAKRLARGKRLSGLLPGETLLKFSVKLQEPSEWYNDCAYLDTLNHQAVKEFIRVTHEAYRKNISKEFGKTVPGIFTDEPNHGGTFGDVTGLPDAVEIP